MSEIDDYKYVTEKWGDDVFKSGCCNQQHAINTDMIQCSEGWQENGIFKGCDIFYCVSYVKNKLNLSQTSMQALLESEGVFKCDEHGFETIHIDNFAFQAPLVEDFENETKVITVTTTRTNRQTGKEEEFAVHFRMTAQNGILSLEINEKGEKWEAAKASKIHKYKKHVLQDVLRQLFGYDDIKQNKDRLEIILCALIGLDEDTRLIVERILGKIAVNEVVELLQQERMVLMLDILNVFEDYNEHDLCNITSYTVDVYKKLFSLHSKTLDDFLLSIWQLLIDEWIKHPTDEKFISGIDDYRDTYDETDEYKALQELYKTFKEQEWFVDYTENEFSLFAYDLSDEIVTLFVKEVKTCIIQIAVEISTKNINAKEMTAEQRWYVGQSIGGATGNSLKRKIYGGNFKDYTRNKLHAMVDSMLLTCKDGTDATISFRLAIEDHGLRILTDKWTEFVCCLLDRIQPKLRNNLILQCNGQFMSLLTELLNDKQIDKSFQLLLVGYDDRDDNDDTDDVKMNDKQKAELDVKLRKKLFKEFVTGVFDKSLWGYLKQIKPDRNNYNLSLRDSLKVHLSTSTPFSSLQVT